MAGFKSTYQGVGFYESPGMWMSSRLDELWLQSPDKHNDSIYSDLAAWMQMDPVGNKFSQAKSSSINQADPGKKNAPRAVQRGCWPSCAVGHFWVSCSQCVWSLIDRHGQRFLFKSSAFRYTIVILQRNKGKNEWRSPQWAICSQYHPTLLFVIQRALGYRAETWHRNVSVSPHEKPTVSESKRCGWALSATTRQSWQLAAAGLSAHTEIPSQRHD